MDWALIIIGLSWTILGSLLVCKVLCPISNDVSNDEFKENTVHKTVYDDDSQQATKALYARKVKKQPLNWCLISSAIIGALYSCYIISHFATGFTENEVAGAISIALVAPHIFIMLVALGFNIAACFNNKHILSLISGICYVVSGFIFPLYFIMVIPEIILVFLGWYKVFKIKKTLP